MKYKFLIIIFLILQSFSSYGDISKKGIICECKNPCPKYAVSTYWYLFENKKVYYYYFKYKNGKYSISKEKGDNFNFDSSYIYFRGKKLNRKTLKIKGVNIFGNHFIYDCSVHPKREFHLIMNAELNYLQSLENKKAKGNKI